MKNEDINAAIDWQEFFQVQIQILDGIAASRVPSVVTKVEIERLDDLFDICKQKGNTQHFGPRANKLKKIIKSYRQAMQKAHVDEIEFIGFDEEYDTKKEKQGGNKNK